MKKPNVLLIMGDQWRYQALGCNDNIQVRTPHIDAFASQSIVIEHACSSTPVCSPFRTSLITGQYPLTHGVFLNDAPLETNVVSIGDAFKSAGYSTGYIGKWHIDGKGRKNYIPKERRLGFEHWQVLECTHNYFDSEYYDDENKSIQKWQGYDAMAQTIAACDFINSSYKENPFFLILSWGPPHDPYRDAPQEYLDLYPPESIRLRPNVPDKIKEKVRHSISGYYAHCSALDTCFNKLMLCLENNGLFKNTIVIFTSDHGDMLGSQGLWLKQKPWEESIRIPFIIRYPGLFGYKEKKLPGVFIDAPDIMPTLLGLCNIEIPETVEGIDYTSTLLGWSKPEKDYAFIACYHPFGNWSSGKGGGLHGFNGREYRGYRTDRYTYVCSLDGPWLLYDNMKDPYQLNNLIGISDYKMLQENMDKKLKLILNTRKDKFLHGTDYIKIWGYKVNGNGTIPI